MSSTTTVPEALPQHSTNEMSSGAPARERGSTIVRHEYRPDIDGLRAIAVVSVVCFHAFPRRIAGGFIGVDIFFVISGYLISTIILSNLEQGSFSIVDFYRRRVRRIFPALVTVMLFCVVVGWLVLLQDEYRQLGGHLAGGAAFIQNFVLWGESGYFDNSPASKPMLHLWSLAIEEQFYIFWPLLLAVAWMRRWRFMRIIAGIAVASFCVNVYLVHYNSTAAFYSPASRFWELMIGGSLAYITLHRRHLISRYGNLQSATGVALVLAGLVLITRERAFPGWWALFPTFGAFLIISAGPGAWLNRRILSSRPFVWCGLISYPLYLWHWPLLSLASITRPGHDFKLKAGLLIASVLLAALTYRYIELKVRRRGTQRGTTLARIDFEGLPKRGEWDFLATQNPDGQAKDGIYSLHAERSAITLFLGDSHVAQYAERVYNVEQGNQAKNGAIFAVGGDCPPVPQVFDDSSPDKLCWSIRRDALAKAADDRITSVVLGGYWSWYFEGHGYYVTEGSRKVSLDTPEGRKDAFEMLDKEVKELESEHKTVYLLLDNPVGLLSERDRLVKIDGVQNEVRRELIELAKRDHAIIIDPESVLCEGGGCARVTKGWSPVYKEASHLNPDWIITNAGYIDAAL